MSANNNIESPTAKSLLKDSGGPGNGDGRHLEGLRGPGFFAKFRQFWFSGKSRDIIGIEIFRDAFNLVHTVKGKTGREVTHAFSEPMPDGMTIEHPAFPGFLKAQIQKTGIVSGKTDIWACLPATKGEIWSVRVPKIKKGLSNAVYWSARKEKAFNDAETVFDYRITGEIIDNGIPKLIAEVCTAPADEVIRYKKLFSDIGFPLKGVTLPAYVMKNLFDRGFADPGQEVYAVLCIGEEYSSIDVHGKDRVLFSRVTRTGKDSILDSLIMECSQHYEGSNGQKAGDPEIVIGWDSNTMQIKLSDRRAAEKMLVTFEGGTEDNNRLVSMVEPALERLARQLERTLDHSVNMLKNRHPARIYICGNISWLPGIDDFFSEQLGIPVYRLDVLDPSFSHVSSEVCFKNAEHRFSLVSTAGLAMSSSRTTNFLHTAMDRDREKLAMRSTNAVAAGCALLFVLMAGYWWYALHGLEQASLEVEQKQAVLNSFSPRLDVETITQLAGMYQQSQKNLADRSRRLYPIAVIDEIHRLTPGNIRMLNITIDTGRPGNGGRGDFEPTIILEGFINSDASVFEAGLAGYIRQLRRSPMVRDVDIRRSLRDGAIAEEDVYRFILKIDLEKV